MTAPAVNVFGCDGGVLPPGAAAALAGLPVVEVMVVDFGGRKLVAGWPGRAG